MRITEIGTHVLGTPWRNLTFVTVRTDAEGAPAGDPSRAGVEGLEPGAAVSISVVGDVPAVLDAESGTLFAAGRTTEVEGGRSAVLQQASEPSDSVVLATAGALVRVPLDGSEPVAQPAGAEGGAAAPVFLEGCAYAAWNGSGKFIRDCVGDDDDLATDIEGVKASSVLRFRVNRDVVVLNDVIGGAAWMASDSMQRVDNWNEITPPEGEAEEDEQTTEETVETTLPERSEVNTPPVATDDSFGVRPGRTTLLPVLDNDSDPDGDVLIAAVADDGPGFGEVTTVNDGAALQIAVPENASGTTSFVYEIDDGRGGTDTARVSLSVHDWSVNSPPVQKRVTSVVVEAGGVVSYNVLPDWIDPDGDDVFLLGVAPAEGDEADFTADGRISGVMTEAGEVRCRVVVNCGGMWAREIGGWVDATVPLHAAEHFYLVTQAVEGLTPGLPVLRDPAHTFARPMHWRMNHRGQRALRDGDWKYLRVDGHDYLFDIPADERERANLGGRQPARLADMRDAWESWNATMPPIPEDATVSLGYSVKAMPQR